MRLSLDDVVSDQSVDIRQRMDETTIQEYMDIFDRLPPVTVYEKPEGYLLADGFHRVAAAHRLGRTQVEAEVRKGTREDALEFAAYANASAPLKLTSEERRIGIRRLNMIHPNWPPQQLGSLMQCSDAVVRTVLQAIQVRREAQTAYELPERHLEEIARAPREQWEPLARATKNKDWTTEEIAAAVRNINSQDVSQEHKQQLLEGDAEPIVTVRGEPALLPPTVRRHLVQEAEKDYLSFLETALYNVAQLRRFSPQEIVHGIEVQRLAPLIRTLPGDIEFLNDLVRLGRQRLEI